MESEPRLPSSYRPYLVAALILASFSFLLPACPTLPKRQQRAPQMPMKTLGRRASVTGQGDPLGPKDSLESILDASSLEVVNYVQALGQKEVDVLGKSRLADYFLLLYDECDLFFEYDTNVDLAKKYTYTIQSKDPQKPAMPMKPFVLLATLAYTAHLSYSLVDAPAGIIYVRNAHEPLPLVCR